MAVFQPPGECPICGADVPPRVLACPECGADAATGWDEEATRYDGLDLPGADREDNGGSPGPGRLRRFRASRGWWLLAGLALLAALFLALRR